MPNQLDLFRILAPSAVLFDYKAAEDAREPKLAYLPTWLPHRNRVDLNKYPMRNGVKVPPTELQDYMVQIRSMFICPCASRNSAQLLQWADGGVVLVCQDYPKSRCQYFVNISSIYERAEHCRVYSADRTGYSNTLGVMGEQRSIDLGDQCPSIALRGYVVKKMSGPIPTESEKAIAKQIKPEEEEKSVLDPADFDASLEKVLSALGKRRSVTREDFDAVVGECDGYRHMVAHDADHRCSKRARESKEAE
uniref:Uncharacterized protein n=1 Tax=Mycena chlorophos TaxID=658473 RepID=A0ABQ0KZC3_MYCCL|nr:predicted protein [Mycena chlorophos]